MQINNKILWDLKQIKDKIWQRTKEQEIEGVSRVSVLNIQHNWKSGKMNHKLDCDQSKIYINISGK